MEIYLIVVAVTNMLCLAFGARIGAKLTKGEPVLEVHPVEAFREGKERRETKKAQTREQTILRNIDAYNGTSAGQQEVE